MFHSIWRPLLVGAFMAGLFIIPAAALADSHKAPLERGEVKYSAQWHKCDNQEDCGPGRNIRKDGVRFKWVSEDGERSHWATRDASASEIADSIRTLRSFFYVPEPEPVVKAEVEVEARVAAAQVAPTQEQAPASPTPAPSTSDVGGGGGSGLDSIRQCESGGDYGAVSPSGQYRGAYQFDTQTWNSVGGSGDPAAASPAEQDRRAAQLQSQRGNQPWPVCG